MYNSNFYSILFLILICIFMVVYFAMGYNLLKKSTRRSDFYKFYKGVKSIIISNLGENFTVDTTNNYELIIKQIYILFFKLNLKYPNNNYKKQNVIDCLEQFLVDIDTGIIKKSYPKFNCTDDLRNIIAIIIERLNSNRPFEKASIKQASLLQQISDSLQLGNLELGKSSLQQLSQELVSLEENLNVQKAKNNTSYLLNIIGLVLTLFFGIISFIQFLNRWLSNLQQFNLKN